MTHRSRCFQAPSSLKARNMETEGEKHILFIYSHTPTALYSLPPSAPAQAPDSKEGLSSRRPPTLPKEDDGWRRSNAFASRFNPRQHRDGVAALRLSIFNCLLRVILHIQSSFPNPLIMDHAYLSCILNVGTELEARNFIPWQ